MKDCISRQELIDALEADYNRPWYSPQGSEEYIEGVRDEYDDVLRIVCEMKPVDVQPTNRWISIEESKPKDMQQVLAVVDGDVREAFYNAGCFIGSNFYRSINEVKWWQSLPEPPKEG